jgi:hypothetical protein
MAVELPFRMAIPGWRFSKVQVTSRCLQALAAITWTPIVASALLIGAGATLLLFTERFQARMLKWHDDLRDAPNTPQYLLHLSGKHYEATMRLVGSLMIIVGLVWLLVTVIRDNSPS